MQQGIGNLEIYRIVVEISLSKRTLVRTKIREGNVKRQPEK
jgi:hypothetical protein